MTAASAAIQHGRRMLSGARNGGAALHPLHLSRAEGKSSDLKTEQENVRAAPEAGGARAWARILADYRKPSNMRGVFEVIITLVPLVLLWVITWWTLDLSYGGSLLLTIPAAGFLLRLFMIQHDCGHGSFFRYRWANNGVGSVIGVLTLTPYRFWQRAHALHHASSGNLDRRGIGDIETLTVREYQALNHLGRLRYRLYRHPVVTFGLGPAYLFLLRHRIPAGQMRDGWRPWLSTMATNATIVAIAAVLIWFLGLKAFLLVHLPIVMLAASAGVWLFYVQHQFEHTSWSHNPEWDRHEAALHGSSHYDLPAVLRWFTANIGVHHVHHLCSGIPYYRLPRTLRDYPELRDIGRLTLLESFGCVRLVLWDEVRLRLVSFREARASL